MPGCSFKLRGFCGFVLPGLFKCCVEASSKARFACDICAAAIEAHMSNIKVVIGFFIVFLAPGRRQEVWLRKGK